MQSEPTTKPGKDDPSVKAADSDGEILPQQALVKATAKDTCPAPSETRMRFKL